MNYKIIVPWETLKQTILDEYNVNVATETVEDIMKSYLDTWYGAFNKMPFMCL